MVFATNSRVREGEDWGWLYPVGIPDIALYRMPLWIKLDTESPIISSRLYLAQAGEGCR